MSKLSKTLTAESLGEVFKELRREHVIKPSYIILTKENLLLMGHTEESAHKLLSDAHE